MKAIGFYKPLPVDDSSSLQDIELPTPASEPRDLLVRVRAISVNPVDTKIRRSAVPEAGKARVLGWDAVGIVEALGSAAKKFKVGDRVYYAGSITRPGTNSELHAVDERIVGIAPRSLDDAETAALPLTTLTAHELLFDRMGIVKGSGQGQTLLVVGGGGGVGSILIQIARQRTKLTVVATASRDETRQWCLELGAHMVVDHSKPLFGELKAAGIGEVDYVTSLTETPRHYKQLVESLKPQGRLGVIDDLTGCDINMMKSKSLSLHHELMFTRSMYETADMAEQGSLLAEIASLVDAGRIKTTLNANFGAINAANLRKAHAHIESGKARGKVVLEGF
jgi:zinc-binding alcohol dehydrogenase family protein